MEQLQSSYVIAKLQKGGDVICVNFNTGKLTNCWDMNMKMLINCINDNMCLFFTKTETAAS